MLLESAAHRVGLAATCKEAVAVLRANGTPDVIVADFHLGGGRTGIETIAALREDCGRQVPAILVTGDTSSGVAAQAAEVDACRMLSKPVDATRLLTELDELANKSVSPII